VTWIKINASNNLFLIETSFIIPKYTRTSAISAFLIFCPLGYESGNKKITNFLAYPQKHVASTICMLTNQEYYSIDIENASTKIIS
jgi:hypothetical protein